MRVESTSLSPQNKQRGSPSVEEAAPPAPRPVQGNRPGRLTPTSSLEPPSKNRLQRQPRPRPAHRTVLRRQHRTGRRRPSSGRSPRTAPPSSPPSVPAAGPSDAPAPPPSRRSDRHVAGTPLFIPTETPAKRRGGCSKVTVSPAAVRHRAHQPDGQLARAARLDVLEALGRGGHPLSNFVLRPPRNPN